MQTHKNFLTYGGWEAENLERVTREKGQRVLSKDPCKKGLSIPVLSGFVPTLSALGGCGLRFSEVCSPESVSKAHP